MVSVADRQLRESNKKNDRSTGERESMRRRIRYRDGKRETNGERKRKAVREGERENVCERGGVRH